MTDEPRGPQSLPGRANSAKIVLWSAFAREVEARGYRVVVRSGGTSPDAFTDYDRREVVVAGHLGALDAIARLAHELGHVHLHVADGVRGSETEFRDAHALREVEAEMFSYVALACHGLRNNESLRYMAAWASHMSPEDPEGVVDKLAARVAEAADEIGASTRAYVLQHRGVMRTKVTTDNGPLFDRDGPGW